MIVGLDASTAIAGEAHGLTIRVIDGVREWFITEVGEADIPVVFSDPFGDLTGCVWQAGMPTGTQEYSCVSFTPMQHCK